MAAKIAAKPTPRSMKRSSTWAPATIIAVAEKVDPCGSTAEMGIDGKSQP
jgi:hypothetical protein